MHYYEHNVGDYRKDTGHLSLLEHGVYRQLLDTYYLDEKPLPLDLQKLMRSHSVRNADEVRALENVLADFFERTEEGYVHKRCESVIDAYKAKSEKASQSAKARWDKEKSDRIANGMRSHSDGNANHKPITINQEPIKTKRAPRFDAQAHLESLGVDSKIATDWIQLRKDKRAYPTETAITDIAAEAAKAGMLLQDALTMSCARGWQGFKAEWANKGGAVRPVEQMNRQEALEARNREVARRVTMEMMAEAGK